MDHTHLFPLEREGLAFFESLGFTEIRLAHHLVLA
jgi:hypothetical protein